MPVTDAHYLELLKQALTGALYDESAWSIEDALLRKLRPGRPMEFVRECVRRLRRWLSAGGIGADVVLVRKNAIDPLITREGKRWPLFGYTLIGMKRLENVQRCMEDVLRNDIPGDFIETGVWRGGCTIFMRALLKCHGVTDRQVWVADSFEGLPPAVGEDAAMKDPDISGTAFLKATLEEVQRNFTRFGMLDEQVRFLKGWFCDTLAQAPIKCLAVLRLDGDMFTSTRDALEALYAKVSPGGFVIIDDYLAWEGCRKAVDAFRQRRGITTPLVTVDWTCVYWQVPPV